jgi:hypothetical protein
MTLSLQRRPRPPRPSARLRCRVSLCADGSTHRWTEGQTQTHTQKLALTHTLLCSHPLPRSRSHRYLPLSSYLFVSSLAPYWLASALRHEPGLTLTPLLPASLPPLHRSHPPSLPRTHSWIYLGRFQTMLIFAPYQVPLTPHTHAYTCIHTELAL